MAKKIQRGERIVVDYYALHTPMLDKDGNQRSSWKGPLWKFGYKKVHGELVGYNYSNDNVMVRLDGYGYDTRLKPSEPAGGCAHTHRAGSLKLETQADIDERDTIPCSKDLDMQWYTESEGWPMDYIEAKGGINKYR